MAQAVLAKCSQWGPKLSGLVISIAPFSYSETTQSLTGTSSQGKKMDSCVI